jgi:C-terminal processing protease CtpA/Prc
MLSDYLHGGIIAGTNIGYIRIDAFVDEAEEHFVWNPDKTEFSKNFETLMASFMVTDGIIIDNRMNEGGMPQIAYKGLRYIIKSDDEEFVFLSSFARNSEKTENLTSFVNNELFDLFPFPVDRDKHYYGKPVICITGPQAISGGDYLSAFCQEHPEFTVIGWPNSGSLAGVDEPVHIDNGIDIIEFRLVVYGMFNAEGENYARKSFVDIPVWHTRENVANGVDTMIEYAMNMIKNPSKPLSLNILRRYHTCTRR